MFHQPNPNDESEAYYVYKPLQDSKSHGLEPKFLWENSTMKKILEIQTPKKPTSNIKSLVKSFIKKQ